MDKLLYKTSNKKGNSNLLMAYPACKSFGLASLGYLWLSKIADEYENITSERIYTDSIAANININNVDAIAFSMSFDFDFMGVFEILENLSINFLSKERAEQEPLVFAGGPVITTNPAPYTDIFDFMIIGDGETTFVKVLDILAKNCSKKETLSELATIDGVFVPSISCKVKKVTETLDKVIYTPIISDESYFKDTFIVEVSRGCMNRCAFCTASYSNLPYRNYEYSKIIEAIDFGLGYTNKIALLGAQISAHPRFNDIMSYLYEKMQQGTNIELGISSLRTDSVTPELVRTLVLGGQKTSTIAIEAASERLRRFVNKNLTEKQILDAVKICRENGLKGLKIYSMIGIPTETDEDINEFIRLAKLIKSENKGFDITFSFSSFVPKPQTPLQWTKRESTKTLEKKQKFLEKELAKIGVSTKFSSMKWDYWQTVLSRGNATFAEFLLNVYKKGGKIGAYKSAIKELDIDISNAVEGFDIAKSLPWDFIETYLPKNLLVNEYSRLLKRSQ